MAVNISGQLDAIKNALDGETVLSAIASAAEVLNQDIYTNASISPYINVIQNGTYGRDIRDAIWRALYMLSIGAPASGGYGSDGASVGLAIPYTTGVITEIDTIVGYVEEV